MTNKPSNPQAYPCLDSNGYGLAMHDPGMSLRDWFAGQALGALIEQIHVNGGCVDGIEKPVASVAYDIADAMLARREQSA